MSVEARLESVLLPILAGTGPFVEEVRGLVSADVRLESGWMFCGGNFFVGEGARKFAFGRISFDTPFRELFSDSIIFFFIGGAAEERDDSSPSKGLFCASVAAGLF